MEMTKHVMEDLLKAAAKLGSDRARAIVREGFTDAPINVMGYQPTLHVAMIISAMNILSGQLGAISSCSVRDGMDQHFEKETFDMFRETWRESFEKASLELAEDGAPDLSSGKSFADLPE